MSLSQVQQALQAAAIDALDDIETAYENAKFSPPSNAKWARMFFIPNTPSPETLGANGVDLVDGILQIDLNYPQDSGTADAIADYETIRGEFPAGAKFTEETQDVSIKNCGRSQGRLVGTWYRVSITITWFAFIPR